MLHKFSNLHQMYGKGIIMARQSLNTMQDGREHTIKLIQRIETDFKSNQGLTLLTPADQVFTRENCYIVNAMATSGHS